MSLIALYFSISLKHLSFLTDYVSEWTLITIKLYAYFAPPLVIGSTYEINLQ
jgi:hypothetical protein